jgi:hypothetical protein
MSAPLVRTVRRTEKCTQLSVTTSRRQMAGLKSSSSRCGDGFAKMQSQISSRSCPSPAIANRLPCKECRAGLGQAGGQEPFGRAGQCASPAKVTAYANVCGTKRVAAQSWINTRKGRRRFEMRRSPTVKVPFTLCLSPVGLLRIGPRPGLDHACPGQTACPCRFFFPSGAKWPGLLKVDPGSWDVECAIDKPIDRLCQQICPGDGL